MKKLPEAPPGTVRIQDPKKKGDYLLINEADFDPKKDKLFKPEADDEPEKKDKRG